MLPWNLKWALTGDRLAFQVSMRPFRCRPGGAAYAARTRARARARARAGGEFCIVQNRSVAMLPWKLKRPFIGGRLGCQVKMRWPGVGQAARRAPRVRRARGRGGLYCAEQKTRNVALGTKVALSGTPLGFQVHMHLFQMSARRRSVRRARARGWGVLHCAD